MLARILLIDDDPAGLLALGELIQRRLDDVSVETVLDVSAALDLLREKDFHVLISDLRMAGLDGLAALNQVRERWPQVQVILITAGGREREEEAVRHGAYAFIQKPISEDELLPPLVGAVRRSARLYREEATNRLNHLHHLLEASRMDPPTLGRGSRDSKDDDR